MNKLIPAALAAATALTTAFTAHAADGRIVLLQQTVRYQPAELVTPHGAQALLARVDGVALRLCRERTHSAFERTSASQVSACRGHAVSRAVAALDAPLVTAAHADHLGAQLAAR